MVARTTGVWLFCHMQKSAHHGKLIHSKRLIAFPFDT